VERRFKLAIKVPARARLRPEPASLSVFEVDPVVEEEVEVLT
jgi:hypothetical protein